MRTKAWDFGRALVCILPTCMYLYVLVWHRFLELPRHNQEVQGLCSLISKRIKPKEEWTWPLKGPTITLPYLAVRWIVFSLPVTHKSAIARFTMKRFPSFHSRLSLNTAPITVRLPKQMVSNINYPIIFKLSRCVSKMHV